MSTIWTGDPNLLRFPSPHPVEVVAAKNVRRKTGVLKTVLVPAVRALERNASDQGFVLTHEISVETPATNEATHAFGYVTVTIAKGAALRTIAVSDALHVALADGVYTQPGDDGNPVEQSATHLLTLRPGQWATLTASNVSTITTVPVISAVAP